MIVYKKQTVSEEVDVPVKAYCNQCSKNITTPSIEHKHIEGAHVSIKGNYGSKHDTEHIEFDLCDECIDKLIAGCQIKPKTTQEL